MIKENTLDALIVGAGFAGLHVLHKLRKLGFKVKIYESGSGIGGTWFWNRYPGARTDSMSSFYQFTQDDIWKGFQWEERFADRNKILSYFAHVDQKLDLSKDIRLNTKVISAEFNELRKQWFIKSDNELHTWANHLVLCTGYAERRFIPRIKGLDNFKGKWCHTSLWPENGVELKGKRVAVVGTGASGVQVIQEIASEVAYLTVYQRTPNLALPMQQCNIKDQSKWKFPQLPSEYQKIFETTRQTLFGMERNFVGLNAMDVTPEERQTLYEYLFAEGGFAFALGNYQDVLINEAANNEMYKFWREKTRARINDPLKKEILAPTIAPHPMLAKRPSLEQRYYEVYNQSNVNIINVRHSPIVEITNCGIKTENEGVTEFDVIIFATGFDFVTGGILNIRIVNGQGETLQDKWKDGVWTNLGLTTAGYPNMYFLLGPQAPTAFSNGPTCIEIQGDWIVNLILYMKNHNKATVVATKIAENDWKKQVNDIWNFTIVSRAESWYNGSNIPGKPVEPLNYLGGIPSYIAALETCAQNKYDGFILESARAISHI